MLNTERSVKSNLNKTKDVYKRQINELPKYGNDIEEIDMLARDVANIYAKELEDVYKRQR